MWHTALAALIAAWAMLPGAALSSGTAGPISSDRVAAIGRTAEAECDATLQARCLATLAIAAIAAGQGQPRAARPAEATAQIVQALLAGGHGATLRSLTMLLESVRRTPPAGADAPEEWNVLTLRRAGLLAQMRIAIEREANPRFRDSLLLHSARITLEPYTIAAAHAAVSRSGDAALREVGLPWMETLALATARDRAGVSAMLDALAAGPVFTDAANGVPVSSIVISGVIDGLRTAAGSYDAVRNLPRLRAIAMALLNDGVAAMEAAEAVRWIPGRIDTLATIGSVLPSLRRDLDERILAAARQAGPTDDVTDSMLGALIRLGRLREAEELIAALTPEQASLDKLAPFRSLARAYASAGDAAGAERVIELARTRLRDEEEEDLGELRAREEERLRQFREMAAARPGTIWTQHREQAERESAQRLGIAEAEADRRVEQSLSRVRLSVLLADRAGHAQARAFLAAHAPRDALVACVASGSVQDCPAFSILLQAIQDAPRAPN